MERHAHKRRLSSGPETSRGKRGNSVLEIPPIPRGREEASNTQPLTLSHDDYTIGWICALHDEFAAAEAMLDEMHPSLPRVGNDPNVYSLGRIGHHNIAITCLPTGEMGTNSAATAAANLLRSFSKLRFGLMVGIGGGVPGEPSEDPSEDIRLGDIVVSRPTESSGGVIQYDFGKVTKEGEIQRTSSLNAPPYEIRTSVMKLQAKHRREESLVPHFLEEMVRRYPKMAKTCRHLGMENDRLFQADYAHEGNGTDCANCDASHLVSRKDRESNDPVIHYGLIGSANQVIKNGIVRENLRRQMNILCVEMEAAGLMNNFPCLVVRGIADYCDTHKNKRWQPYAAATAAAYAKELIQIIPVVDVEPMTETVKKQVILHEHFNTVNAKLDLLIQATKISSASKALSWEAYCGIMFQILMHNWEEGPAAADAPVLLADTGCNARNIRMPRIETWNFEGFLPCHKMVMNLVLKQIYNNKAWTPSTTPNTTKTYR